MFQARVDEFIHKLNTQEESNFMSKKQCDEFQLKIMH